MGKRQSKPSIQAWISRESPEGGCVIINDTSSQTRLLEEILKQKRSVTAYEGYLVNEEDNLDPIDWEDSVSGAGKCKSDETFPIEIVELPSEPDGKHIDIHFVREGQQNDHATQTPSSLKPEDINCGVSVRSMGSDRQQWSFSLYNFEENGRISREDLTNLVRSIYDALGKSVDKASRKSSTDQVKKVKVHIAVSKQKQRREMRGASIVPRREVVIGAEDTTANSDKHQNDDLPIDASKKTRRRKERDEKCSTLQVLNNELGNVHLHSGKCKACSPRTEQHNKYDFTKRCSGQAIKNSNLFADNPNYPSRRRTGPGGVVADTKLALLNQDLEFLVEKETKVRSQRRSSRRRPTYPGHQSPPGEHSGYSSPMPPTPDRLSPRSQHSGNSSPTAHVTGRISPALNSPKRDVSLDPSYAYHADDNRYLYVHAMPRQTPFEEPKARKKRRSKTRKARESQEIPDGGLARFKGPSKPVVHRHEHVHHHYHHYEEKR